MPQRIQRKRTKGWKMPPNTVYVGRPTKWGNPWKAGQSEGFTVNDAVANYRAWVKSWGDRQPLKAELASLRGKNLACFCPLDQPCHADVLLEIALADSGR